MELLWIFSVDFDVTDQRKITNSDFVKYSRKNYDGAWDWIRKSILFDISSSFVFELNRLG